METIKKFCDKLTLLFLIVNGIFFIYSIIKGDFHLAIVYGMNFAWLFLVRYLECKIDNLAYIILNLKILLSMTRIFLCSKNFYSLLKSHEKENLKKLESAIDEIMIGKMPDKRK